MSPWRAKPSVCAFLSLLFHATHLQYRTLNTRIQAAHRLYKTVMAQLTHTYTPSSRVDSEQERM